MARATIECVLLLSLMLLAGCATGPVATVPQELFDDHLFASPASRIDANDVFAASPEMRRFIDSEIAGAIAAKGRQQALFDALYARGELRLEYDSAKTRNAAEAFAARAGNCLSLVIMTAAFAKQLDLPVRYQSAYEETWNRTDDAHYFVGHVNITLGRRPGFSSKDSEAATIDFLPALEARALRTHEIAEVTIIAMYMNNRAAEALNEGELDDAYAWARMAIAQDPGFVSAYNTLGVIYLRHGNLEQARRALAFALARAPANAHVMSNLVSVLRAQGRLAEADALRKELDQLDPHPAFAFFYEGVKAMGVRDYAAARDYFSKEVDRAPYYHELRYWLAAAYVGLGEFDEARKQLALAIEYSTTRRERDVYSAKLNRLAAHRAQP
ncbi:MAG TPA: tetratricopeptide repeat protein [Casimicrobiaceae bacterium]|nr:tetratricopeptide repeat protein [Casimicrobiaceae bacterium]